MIFRSLIIHAWREWKSLWEDQQAFKQVTEKVFMNLTCYVLRMIFHWVDFCHLHPRRGGVIRFIVLAAVALLGLWLYMFALILFTSPKHILCDLSLKSLSIWTTREQFCNVDDNIFFSNHKCFHIHFKFGWYLAVFLIYIYQSNDFL